ncbi:hypothetical protein ACO0LC_23415 [Undibacterium sp. JH2W]
MDIARQTFARQVIDSVRRIGFVPAVARSRISARRANPDDVMFDPVRAAILAHRHGDVDEASWIIFLSVHFGMHPIAKWRYLREVYGKLGAQTYWSWAEICQHPYDFQDWLRENQNHLLRGSRRGFGNHRKYQSMDADSATGTGVAVLSYVDWIKRNGGHTPLFARAYAEHHDDAYAAFDSLYQQMDTVISFGRVAKFDYLTMLGKLSLAIIKPPKAYIAGTSGPKNGARLMLQGSTDAALANAELERRLRIIGDYLGVSMQVMEDSLCNWQESPQHYRLFTS